jgi:hypothetical protein
LPELVAKFECNSAEIWLLIFQVLSTRDVIASSLLLVDLYMPSVNRKGKRLVEIFKRGWIPITVSKEVLRIFVKMVGVKKCFYHT